MLSVTSATRVLVATTPVDLRGSFNRHYCLVVEQLKGDPLITQIKEFTPATGFNAKAKDKLIAQAT